MTIAMCYLSPEGVVFGADSTSTAMVSPSEGIVGHHYLNNNQKLFQLGEESTIGVLTWGLGGLTAKSHRTMLALLADNLKVNPASSVSEVADRWASLFWNEYNNDPAIKNYKDLEAKSLFSTNETDLALDARTRDEELCIQQLKGNLTVGFCIAGYTLPDRTVKGFEIIFDPSLKENPNPSEFYGCGCWGGAEHDPSPIFWH
jgi:hypothetical protein